MNSGKACYPFPSPAVFQYILAILSPILFCVSTPFPATLFHGQTEHPVVLSCFYKCNQISVKYNSTTNTVPKSPRYRLSMCTRHVPYQMQSTLNSFFLFSYSFNKTITYVRQKPDKSRMHPESPITFQVCHLIHTEHTR